jgi:hypothetical protein
VTVRYSPSNALPASRGARSRDVVGDHQRGDEDHPRDLRMAAGGEVGVAAAERGLAHRHALLVRPRQGGVGAEP